MRKHIPNFITLCNLMAGSVAILMILGDKPGVAIILVLVAAVLDFLDGMTARLLNATSEIGKQLDSFADIVSFGLVPAAFIYKILQLQLDALPGDSIWNTPVVSLLVFISALIVPVFSAIRLARFNIQKDGVDSFFGLPTPAHALFWTGIYYDMIINGSFYGQEISIGFLLIMMLVLALMMIIPLKMISLKFKSLNFKANIFRYLTLIIGLIFLIFMMVPGLSLVVVTYILLSLVRIILT